MAPDALVSGAISELQTAELVGRDAFVFQHHGNVVIYPVYPLPILGDQSFCQGLGNAVIAGVSDLSASDLMVDLAQFIGTQESERLLGYRATQNL